MGASEDELLAVAHDAARASAGELMSRFGQRQRDIRAKSGPTDLVSEADVSAEAAIRRVLAERRPDDAILGEEGGETGEGELRWVIDPLDGTINFLFGIPLFAVSVACEDREGAVVGVVLDPVRDETFAATRSGAPVLNGAAIESSGRDDLSRALVATGFAYDAAVRAKQAVAVGRVLPQVRDIRRGGSAALDLAWCACGRYDAYYERGVKAWDITAGALIAQRAGLVLRDLPDGDDGPHGVLAASPALADELLRLVLGP
ncbi:MAG TPA: inositol monophosphatase family protein [Solirubrobacteraceae bacterium]|jgi:myo-inositol-1(or 4)-monophosphatase|nr:inositol monophosphatase family protein [Solirubrobacteraceae bacterium]